MGDRLPCWNFVSFTELCFFFLNYFQEVWCHSCCGDLVLFLKKILLELPIVLFFKSCTEKISSRDLMVCFFKEQISQLRNISTANKTGDLWS